LLFKCVNLYRYGTGSNTGFPFDEAPLYSNASLFSSNVGPPYKTECSPKLNSVAHDGLKAAWFQPLNLKSEKQSADAILDTSLSGIHFNP
jgi:hypothetical protein